MTQFDSQLTSVPSDGTPWCEVRIDDRTIRYRRVGVGRPLIVLSTNAHDALWPSVMEALALRHRLYQPELPCSDGELGSWLRSFMEGVGAESATLVADGTMCIPALEFALLEADRIERLVLVPSGGAEIRGVDGALADTTGRTVLPILVLRREHAEQFALELVSGFLDQPRRVQQP